MKVDYKSIADYCDLNGWTDYAVAFDTMTAETVTEPKDIDVADIKAYLTLVDKRLAIEESTTVSAKKARLSFMDFESYRLTDQVNGSAYLAQLTAVLDALITDGLIDANDKAAILAMGQQEDKPKWPGLSVGHVASAIDKRRLGEI